MFYVFVTFTNQMPSKQERKSLKLKPGQLITEKVRYTVNCERDADDMAIYYRQAGYSAYVERA